MLAFVKADKRNKLSDIKRISLSTLGDRLWRWPNSSRMSIDSKAFPFVDITH
jgi:hypothetical protein